MSAIDVFVAAFFGDGNNLSRADPHVAPLADSVCKGWPAVPLALPRTGDARADGKVRWYVVSPSASEDARVAEEITAWIGPTYSGSWRSLPAALDVSDPIDQAVLNLEAGATYTVDVAEGDRATVRENLEQLRALWVERPVGRGGLEARTSELVRDLRLSVSGGNPETARQAFRELKRRALLSAENELFLEIVILEAEESWEAIAAHRHLGDLSARDRPWAVTRAMIRALYRRVLVEAEDAEDLDQWVNKASQVEAEHPGLFSTRGPLDAPEIAKAFALIDRSHPDRPLRTRLRVLEAKNLSKTDLAFLEAVVQTAEQTQKADPVDAVQHHLTIADYDAAWDLAADLPVGRQRAVLLVQCATELASASSNEIALAAFNNLPEGEREAELKRSRRIARDIEELEDALVGDPAGGNDSTGQQSWEQWFKYLHGREDWTEAVSVAELGALDWDRTYLVSEDGHELAALIRHGRTASQQRTFLRASPFLLDWLEAAESTEAVLGIRLATLDAVCLGEVRGDVALEVALALAESILAAGVTGDEYAEVLSLLETVWDQNAAARTVSWLTECLEVISEGAGSAEHLKGAAAAMVAKTTPFLGRIDAATIDQLAAAATASGLPESAVPVPDEVLPSRVPDEIAQRFETATIGCYTLSPQVGVRVKADLENLLPGAKVIVNGDTESTDALANLARTAEYLIVMIRSAKHAATDAIDKQRPSDLPTLKVGCRGSSGVVAFFLESIMSA